MLVHFDRNIALFKSIFLISTFFISQISYAGVYFCQVANGILSILIKDDYDLLDAMTIDVNKLSFNTQVDFQYISCSCFSFPPNETLAIQLLKTLLNCDEENKLNCVDFDRESTEKDRFFSYLIDVDSQTWIIHECYHPGEKVTLPYSDVFMTDAFKVFRDIYRSNYQDQGVTESTSEIDRRIARLWCNPDFKHHDFYIKMSWEKFIVNNPQFLVVKKTNSNKRKSNKRKRKNPEINTSFQFLPMKRLRSKYRYSDYCIEPYSYIK